MSYHCVGVCVCVCLSESVNVKIVLLQSFTLLNPLVVEVFPGNLPTQIAFCFTLQYVTGVTSALEYGITLNG